MPEGRGLENEGNGHNPEANTELENNYEGGSQTLDRNRHTINMENRAYNSVLQQMMHSIDSDVQFRQQLARAVWESKDDYVDWCNAYDECKRYGADPEWLVNRLIAASAGVNGWLVKSIMDTISHTSYTINSNNQKKAWGLLRGREENDNKRSPLF